MPRPMPALPPVTSATLSASLPVIVVPHWHLLLYRPRRHIRKERAEALGHGRMRDDGVAELRKWQARKHRGLHHGHDFAGLGANHREAEDAVVTPNKRLHEPLCLAC